MLLVTDHCTLSSCCVLSEKSSCTYPENHEMLDSFISYVSSQAILCYHKCMMIYAVLKGYHTGFYQESLFNVKKEYF